VIRLLIVDDSPLMRRLLTDIFTGTGDFAVEVARHGEEALEALPRFAPHVITMDIHMPGMGGLACLDQIMLRRPTPVVMISSLTAQGADETLEAMALGAVDFVTKPGGAVSLGIEDMAPILIDKVRQAAKAHLPRTHRLAERLRTQTRQPRAKPQPLAGDHERVVLIGCSTGGPPALEAVLADLPGDFAWPVVVAQHMPAAFTGAMARRLDGICALHVVEVTRSAVLRPGTVYIGRGDADLVITRRATGLSAAAVPIRPEFHWHPSVDRLVTSALDHLAPGDLVGVLMTGMGSDGAASMGALRAGGGHTIAEAQDTAVVWGMPGSLVAAGGASVVLPLDAIGGHLTSLVAR
jgi:two-component system chemotaxis response regulator CheB